MTVSRVSRHSDEGIIAESAGRVLSTYTVFCHRCASSIVSGARFGYDADMRVCNFCLQLIDDYRPESPAFDVKSTSSGVNAQGEFQNRVRSASISFPIANQHTLQLSMSDRHNSTSPLDQDAPSRETGFRTMFFRQQDQSVILPSTSAPFRRSHNNPKKYENPLEDEPTHGLEGAYNSADQWQPSPFLATIHNPFNTTLHLPDPEATRRNIYGTRKSITSLPRKGSTVASKANPMLNILNPNTWLAHTVAEPSVGLMYDSPAEVDSVHPIMPLPMATPDLKMELNEASLRHLNLLMHQVIFI
jgi:hypothetical protein